MIGKASDPRSKGLGSKQNYKERAEHYGLFTTPRRSHSTSWSWTTVDEMDGLGITNETFPSAPLARLARVTHVITCFFASVVMAMIHAAYV